MRLSAVYALKRAAESAHQGSFTILHNVEVQVLETLPGWFMRLFSALVRNTDFKLGTGNTSYANLHGLMNQTIQRRRGLRHYVPDIQAIKKAVRLMEERGLLKRDKKACQDEERLIFSMPPRYAQARLIRKVEAPTRTPRNAAQAPRHRGSKAAGGESRTPKSNPLSEAIYIHKAVDNFEPDGGALRAGAAPKLGPPRGPDRGSPHGDPTPPRPTYFGRRVLALQQGKHVAPQGADTSPPQGGHAPSAGRPPSARLRRPSNTVLTVDAGEAPGCLNGT